MDSKGIAPSSLFLQRTLRESASPFQSVCYMKVSGYFASYDEQAIRLWSLQKQIKSLCFDLKEKNLRFLGMHPIDDIDCVLLLFSVTKAANSDGGSIYIFSNNLSLVQEISLNMPPLEKFIVSSNQLEIILLDKSRSAHVLHLETLFNPNNDSDRMTSTANVTLSELRKQPTEYIPKKKKKQAVKLHKVQVVDCGQIELLDVIMINEDILAMLCPTNIMILTRPCLQEIKPKSPSRRNGSQSAVEEKPKLSDNKFHEFIHTATLMLKYDIFKRKPTMIKAYKQPFILVAFDDGHVQFIQHSEELLRKDRNVLRPIGSPALTLLLNDFGTGHEIPPSEKEKLWRLRSIFDGNVCNTYGSNGYLQEIYTVGYDLTIKHWGLRYAVNPDFASFEIERSDQSQQSSQDGLNLDEPEKSSSPSTPKGGDENNSPTSIESKKIYTEETISPFPHGYIVAADNLGEYQLQDAALVANPKLRAKYLSYLQLLGIELKSSDHNRYPMIKQLLGAFGGGLYVWDIIHPHRAISIFKSKVQLPRDKSLNKNEANERDIQHLIQQAVRGPDIQSCSKSQHLLTQNVTLEEYPFANSQQRPVDKPLKPENTILLMKEGVVELIKVSSGERLYSVNLDHLLETNQSLPRSLKMTNTGKIVNDIQLKKFEESLEIRASVVHFCAYSQQILVGYHSGNVGFTAFGGSVYSSITALNFSYLNTRKVHTGKITMIKTFPFHYNPKLIIDPLGKDLSEDIVIAVIGDANGSLSLWQISPPRKNQSPLLHSVKQHLGEIQYCNLCRVAEGLIEDPNPDKTSLSLREATNNHSILITGCTKGMIYAWRVEITGQIQMIAYVHSTHSNSLLPVGNTTIRPKATSLLTLPKIIYRQVSVFRPKQASKTSDFVEDGYEEIQIAQVYYEIFCIMGYSDGFQEIFILSSDPQYCSASPVFSRQDLPFAVTTLSTYVHTCSTKEEHQSQPHIFSYENHTVINSIVKDFAVVNYPSSTVEEDHMRLDFKLANDQDYFLSGYQDGTVGVYQMTINSLFTLSMPPGINFLSSVSTVASTASSATSSQKRVAVQKMFHLKLPVGLTTLIAFPKYSSENSMSDPAEINQRNHAAGWNYAFVGEFDIYEFFPYVIEGQLVPKDWHRHQRRERSASKPFLQLPNSNNINTVGAAGSAELSLHSIMNNKTPIAEEPIVVYQSPLPDVDRRRPPPLSLEQGVEHSSVDSGVVLTDTLTTPAGSLTRNHTGVDEMINDANNEDGKRVIFTDEGNLLNSEDSMSLTTNSVNCNNTANTSTGSTGGIALLSPSKDKRQYIGPMEAMQRIMSTDFHLAKKDKRLLELFVQHTDGDSADGTISPATVIEIIYQWIQESYSHKNEIGDTGTTKTKGKKHFPSKPPYVQTYSNISSSSQSISTNTLSSTDGGSIEEKASTSNSLTILKKENIWDLLKLLEIPPDVKLKFIEVAKIASITATAVQRRLQQQPDAASTYPKKVYKNLKSYTVKVSYNSMGEKIFEKVPIKEETMGVPTADTGVFRKILYDIVGKMYTPLAPPAKIQSTKRKLIKYPKMFYKILNPMCLPVLKDAWSSSGVHYLDPLRSIRIIRTLLDMRTIQQQELRQQALPILTNLAATNASLALPQPYPTVNTFNQPVQSLHELVIKYFERQYGECSRTMNVTNFKVANFLEACLQYDQYAIIRIVKSMLSLDEVPSIETAGEVAIWLVTEARDMLLSRGCVVSGGIVRPFEIQNQNSTALPDPNILDGSIISNVTGDTPSASTGLFGVQKTESNSSQKVRWQYISKQDAITCCDELLRIRGRFGPHTYLAIYQMVEQLPSATYGQILFEKAQYDTPQFMQQQATAQETNILFNENEVMIDLEKFLELLYFEYINQQKSIRDQTSLVFGEYSMDEAVTAVPRRINESKSKRRQLILDDQDQGFGPHHSLNLSRIRDFIYAGIQKDPLRTGEITNEQLLKVCMHVFVEKAQLPVTDHNAVLCGRLIQMVKEKTKIRSIEDKLSYIDMVAMLLAWEEQNQGNKIITLDDLLTAVPNIERGIEQTLAKNVVDYFTTVSSVIDIENPLWTLANANTNIKHRVSTMNFGTTEVDIADSKTFAIPLDGKWIPTDRLPAEELPEQLMIKQATMHELKAKDERMINHMIFFQDHAREMQTLVIPQVLQTARAMPSILGETVKPLGTSTVAPLTLKLLSTENIKKQDIDTAAFERTEGRARSSYSRTIQKFDIPGVVVDEFQSNSMPGSAERPKTSSIMLPTQMREIDEANFNDNAQIPCSCDISIYQQGDGNVTLPRQKTPENPRSLVYNEHDELDNEFYNLLREESVDTVDSNYRHYSLSFTNQIKSPGIAPAKNQQIEQRVISPDPTRDALTPFLQFFDEELLMPLPSITGTITERGLQQQSSSISAGSSSTPLIDARKQIAHDEINRRIQQLKLLEEEFQIMHEHERDSFQARREEKEHKREQLRREMRLKERIGMQYYYKALEDRGGRVAKGRAQLAQMEALEMEDKKQKELEIQRILEQNRAGALQRAQDKQDEEARSTLQKLVEKEQKLMLKEDKLSFAIRNALLEQKRKELAAQKLKEEMEMAQHLEAMKAKRMEEEAAAAAAEAERQATEAAAAAESVIEIAENDDEAKEDVEQDINLASDSLASVSFDFPSESRDVEDGEELEEDEGDEDEGEDNEDDVVDTKNKKEQTKSRAATPVSASEPSTAPTSAGSSPRGLTAAERHIQTLVHNMKDALQKHPFHPRKEKGKFFIPMTFAEDITFDPFNSTITNPFGDMLASPQTNTFEDEDDMVDVEDPYAFIKPNPFQDLQNVLKKHRKQMEKKRKLLFSTKMDDVPPEEWTPMWRVTGSNWKRFFKNEQQKLQTLREMEEERHRQYVEEQERLKKLEEEEDEEDDFRQVNASYLDQRRPSDSSTSTLNSLSSSTQVSSAIGKGQTIPSATNIIPSTLLQAIPTDTNPVNILPLATLVTEQRISNCTDLKFYQLTLVDSDCLLTVELQCHKGGASAYVQYDAIPSTVKYDAMVNCSRTTSRYGRIILPVEKSGPYYITIQSTKRNGCIFDLQATATGKHIPPEETPIVGSLRTVSIAEGKSTDLPVLEEEENPTYQKVNNLLHKWHILLNKYTEDELLLHFPRLEEQARKELTQILHYKKQLEEQELAQQAFLRQQQAEEIESRLRIDTESLGSFSMEEGKSHAVASGTGTPKLTRQSSSTSVNTPSKASKRSPFNRSPSNKLLSTSSSVSPDKVVTTTQQVSTKKFDGVLSLLEDPNLLPMGPSPSTKPGNPSPSVFLGPSYTFSTAPTSEKAHSPMNLGSQSHSHSFSTPYSTLPLMSTHPSISQSQSQPVLPLGNILEHSTSFDPFPSTAGMSSKWKSKSTSALLPNPKQLPALSQPPTLALPNKNTSMSATQLRSLPTTPNDTRHLPALHLLSPNPDLSFGTSLPVSLSWHNHTTSSLSPVFLHNPDLPATGVEMRRGGGGMISGSASGKRKFKEEKVNAVTPSGKLLNKSYLTIPKPISYNLQKYNK